ncbi:TadE-like protein [Caballeronia udeis]|uniref:TadE-like protein n=2 Tax=Caballeronia udeis TaxID=1232866 RepID=A0A158JSN9_9BURK|nr:TadE/TadG family type IV pilus assembly protein [Caballeronia udeis]SAL71836.1 TadE-like protein [Caballeronia udeis]
MKNRTSSERSRSRSKATQPKIVSATTLKKHLGLGRLWASRFCHASRAEISRARVAAKWFAGFCSEDRGVSALEFAIVFPLFMGAMIGTYQFGMSFVTQSLIDNATRDAARQIRIGTITGTSSKYTPSLVSAVCKDLTVSGYNLVPSCTTSIQIYVAAASSGTPAGAGFTTLSVASVNKGVMTQTKASLSPKYDVILQVGYNKSLLGSLSSGTAMVMSTLAFQTEPY